MGWRKAFAGGLLAWSSLGAHAQAQVDVRVWDTSGAGEAVFPEESAAEAPADWRDKPSFGVAFAGGGTRAASAALGQLRALVRLGWYPRIKYISSISGGTWGTLPFTYLPEAFEDEEFLGPLKAPGALEQADFDVAPRHSMARAIAQAALIPAVLGAWATGKGDESYAAALNRAFLEPFGLGRGDRSFAWTPEHVQGIVARNSGCFDAPLAKQLPPPRRACMPGELPAAYLQPDEFYLPRANRPFHIANASLLAERSMLRIELDPAWLHPVEITPLYAGVPRSKVHEYAGTGEKQPIGGALVESFALDAWPPAKVDAPANVDAPPTLYRAALRRERYRFTLADVIAASGAAPQQATSSIGFRNLGLPEFNHWAMHEGSVARPLLHELAYGDGGHVDNLGLPALLERRVQNVIMFVNMLQPFRAARGRPEYPIDRRSMSRQLLAYFDPRHPNHVIAGVHDVQCGGLAGPACALQDLYEAFALAQRHGEPLTHCRTYDINTANERFRIPASIAPTRICWLYLDGSAQWVQAAGSNAKLSRDLRLALALRTGDHRHFPHYATFFENLVDLKEVVEYKPSQVAALSQLTGWSLCRSAARIAQAFAPMHLPQQGCPGIPSKPD